MKMKTIVLCMEDGYFARHPDWVDARPPEQAFFAFKVDVQHYYYACPDFQLAAAWQKERISK